MGQRPLRHVGCDSAFPPHRGGRRRQRDDRPPHHGLVQIPWRDFVSALHHPLSVYLFADELGAASCRLSSVDTYFCRSLRFHPFYWRGLGGIEALRRAHPRMAQAAFPHRQKSQGLKIGPTSKKTPVAI